MNRIRVVLLTAVFFLMVSGVTGINALASSYSEGNDQVDGHDAGNVFNTHFTDLDADKDNGLSLKEFQTLFPSTQKSAFDRLDTDKDGMLNHEEWHQFKEMHKDMGEKYHKDRYHTEKLPDPSKFNAHFPDMDSDGNGRVTLPEFTAYFPDASDPEDVFKAIDLNGSGDLDHDEWHEFKSAHELKHID